MLCLVVRLDESVIIRVHGEEIKVTLLETRHGRANVGFTASPSVEIDRSSVRESKDRDRAQESIHP